MSVICGIRRPPGAIVEQQDALRLAAATERYAADGTSSVALGRIGMGFQPCHTHKRSNLESQPLIDVRGNMITLDGRIDNHAELCTLLDLSKDDTADSLIVLSAFIRWGDACFSRFIGDWALALWWASEQAVYLARDHAGTRSLYFRETGGVLRWSTCLDTFFGDGEAYPLDEQYAARYLGSQPIHDLTPYQGIRSVPPAHYLVLHDNRLRKTAHWEWMAKEKTLCASDTDYEECFFSLLKQSVLRRDGPGAPRIAQLSGGMDSTSIVCMSDHARHSQSPHTDLIDTISFYDDSEPNWNERPYFSAVESKRGKTGIHVKTSFMDHTFVPVDSSRGVYRLPGADSSAIEWEQKLRDCLNTRGYRAILSGVGGDEVLGGVPGAYPELADYIMSGNLIRLLIRTIAWCLVDRRPLTHMLFDTAKYTLQMYRQPQTIVESIPGWIRPHLRRYCMERAGSPDIRGPLRLGSSPSAIDNGLTWWTIMETLPHLRPAVLTRYEYRYPYLDRDLVDFMFRIPREQIVRPGRRRSLMRRALKNLVPVEVLERRRKAYMARGPLSSLQNARETIEKLFANSLVAEYGFIDPMQLRAAYHRTVIGTDTNCTSALMRCIGFELWLRSTFTVIAPS